MKIINQITGGFEYQWFQVPFFIPFQLMRYFIELAYNGTHYSGWQKQPNAPSIQQTLDEAFSLLLREKIEVTGCGRTDAGVHAAHYIAHADIEQDLHPKFRQRINKFLPKDINISAITPMADDAHARFDATHRAYKYLISFHKDPFRQDTVYYYPYPDLPDFKKLNEAAQLLLEYKEFFPFCKSNNDAKTMKCDLFTAYWEETKDKKGLQFNISANRFLRGMVRLVVGMCLNVATGKVELNVVRKALEQQTRLPKDNSAPACGLYLTDIRYPHYEG